MFFHEGFDDFDPVRTQIKDEVIKRLALIGIHEDSVHWVPVQQGHDHEETEAEPSTYRLIGTFLLGGIAFTNRVQNPDQKDFDDQFRAMMFEERKKGFSTEAQSELDKLIDDTGRD